MKRWVDLLLRYDWTLLAASVALSAIGLLAIYGIGISRGTGDLFQFHKQLIALVIGVGIAATLSLIDYRHVRALALLIYGAGAAVLSMALLIGTSNRNGGKWFVIGSLSFQPVELAKILLAIFLASYLARHVHKRLEWTPFIGSAVATACYVILILLQPDFGSAIVLIFMWGVVVLFCGLPRHAWWVLLLGGVVAAALLWTVGLKPYQRARLTSFVSPAADPYGAAYNVTQARIAIGSGGWLGKGIGEGSQARLRFLPEAATDFMFAVLGESLGFVGLAVLLTIFGLLFYRLIHIGMVSEDAFAGIFAVAFAASMMFHLLVNAGMNLGLLPVTGIPLPFASAASSSLVSLFCGIGLAESIAVHSPGLFRLR